MFILSLLIALACAARYHFEGDWGWIVCSAIWFFSAYNSYQLDKTEKERKELLNKLKEDIKQLEEDNNKPV